MHSRRGFTLIELLVVVGIVAVLAVTVILTLNPTDLLRQARDSNRIADMNALTKALSLFQSEVANAAMGSSTKLYVSIPDSSATCANLGLPTLPTGYTYGCASSSTFRNVDGTGWIPVNLGLVSAGAPISQLPIDPANTTSTGLYYTYIPGASTFEVTSLPESTKYRMGGSGDVTSEDGGQYPELLEKGTSLRMTPLLRDPTLFVYWPLNESSGSTAKDYAMYGRNGSVTYRSTVNPAAWVTGKMGNGFHDAGYNYSSEEKVGMGATKFGDAGNPPQQTDFTVSMWLYLDATQPVAGNGILAGRWWGGAPFYQGYELTYNSTTQKFIFDISANGTGVSASLTSNANVALGNWYLITAVHKSGEKIQLYLNGALDKEATYTSGLWQQSPAFAIGCNTNNSSCSGAGIFDEVKVYNRALTAAEVSALYSAAQ